MDYIVVRSHLLKRVRAPGLSINQSPKPIWRMTWLTVKFEGWVQEHRIRTTESISCYVEITQVPCRRIARALLPDLQQLTVQPRGDWAKAELPSWSSGREVDGERCGVVLRTALSIIDIRIQSQEGYTQPSFFIMFPSCSWMCVVPRSEQRTAPGLGPLQEMYTRASVSPKL